jgi:catalase
MWAMSDRGIPRSYRMMEGFRVHTFKLVFGFDLIDPTKLLPEELVPVRRVGKLTLNRNPQNFFAETEQVAFCVQNVVPGIDFTNDPLMQARLFSYLDTQLTRLGGPNFARARSRRP